MTDDDLRAAHARALAVSSRLRLPMRSRTWRGQAGEFAGGGTGSSLDFQDHRSYVPGDDPRHISWQAYARTGHYTMKLYREEVRPVVDVLLDASESMFFEVSKARRVAELLYLLFEGASAVGAAVAVQAVRGSSWRTLSAEDVRSHRWLEQVRAIPCADPGLAVDWQQVPLRANAIRVVLSDLLFPGDPETVLRHLGQRHGAVMVLAPFIRAESQPEWQGNYEFIDPERGGDRPLRIEPGILQRYLDAYAAHFAGWRAAALRYQAAFARVGAEDDLATALHREAVGAGAFETTRS